MTWRAVELVRGVGSLRPQHRGCVATIGNFDGVHRGHQMVLGQLARAGESLGLPGVLITFEPHPMEFFNPDGAPARLSRLREKLLALVAKYSKPTATSRPRIPTTKLIDSSTAPASAPIRLAPSAWSFRLATSKARAKATPLPTTSLCRANCEATSPLDKPEIPIATEGIPSSRAPKIRRNSIR